MLWYTIRLGEDKSTIITINWTGRLILLKQKWMKFEKRLNIQIQLARTIETVTKLVSGINESTLTVTLCLFYDQKIYFYYLYKYVDIWKCFFVGNGKNKIIMKFTKIFDQTPISTHSMKFTHSHHVRFIDLLSSRTIAEVHGDFELSNHTNNKELIRTQVTTRN